jgi:hypothetical protein
MIAVLMDDLAFITPYLDITCSVFMEIETLPHAITDLKMF